MGLPAHKLATWEEYLALEAVSETRHEFHDGEMVAMAGGSKRHAFLTLSIGAELRAALRGRPCRSYSPDLLLGVEATNHGFYPDASVYCDEPQAGTGEDNPTVVVEVLSPSTERFDRGDKFYHYQQVPSLQHYVLVSQHRARIEVYTRTEEGWLLRIFGPGSRALLPYLGIEIEVDEVYRDAPVMERE